MKKLLSSLSFLPVFPAIAGPVFAQTSVNPCPQDQFAPLCQLTSGNFGNIVGTLVTIAFVLAVIIALAFLIYGGIRWIISGGDKSAVESARNTIIAAVVGLVIIFLAYFILNIVIGFFLPGFSLQNLSLPSLTIQ